ncbi:MAG: hypothetical protein SGPRY_014489 [Prymnesium sp.]
MLGLAELAPFRAFLSETAAKCQNGDVQRALRSRRIHARAQLESAPVTICMDTTLAMPQPPLTPEEEGRLVQQLAELGATPRGGGSSEALASDEPPTVEINLSLNTESEPGAAEQEDVNLSLSNESETATAKPQEFHVSPSTENGTAEVKPEEVNLSFNASMESDAVREEEPSLVALESGSQPPDSSLPKAGVSMVRQPIHASPLLPFPPTRQSLCLPCQVSAAEVDEALRLRAAALLPRKVPSFLVDGGGGPKGSNWTTGPCVHLLKACCNTTLPAQ